MKQHSLITLSTGNFFESGLALLKTWRRSGADRLVVYGYHFDNKLKGHIRRQYKAKFTRLSISDFVSKIMFYKFVIIRDHLVKNLGIDRYVTYVDFDTMIVQSLKSIYKKCGFDVGFTVRPNARSPVLNTNGGVMFIKCNQKSIDFFNWAIEFITKSSEGEILEGLPEYYSIAERCHVNIRNLRWWCDQLFTSAVCENIYKNQGKPTLEDRAIYSFGQYKIGMFNCPIYNDTGEFTLENIHDPEYLKNRYVIHFKGRRKKRVYVFFLPELRGSGSELSTCSIG